MSATHTEKSNPRRRRKPSEPTPLFTLIQPVIGKFLDRPIARALRLQSSWDHAVGHAVARHTEPTRLTEKILTVRVDTSVWATQIRFLKPTILKKLQNSAPEWNIQDLRVKVGVLQRFQPFDKKKHLMKPVAVLPEATPEEQERSNALTHTVTHEPLREALYQLLLTNIIQSR